MSVQIIPASSPGEARVISTEDGYSCECRNYFRKNRPGKDWANGVSVKKEAVTIDLAPLLKRQSFDSNNPITVFINCGSVPVEERRYWDVTVYNSDRMRKGQQYKSVRIDEAYEDKTHHIHGGVFRILTHPKHDINVPTNNDEGTPTGWTQTCSNAKPPYIDTKKLAFRILFHPQLPNLVYTRNVHLWIDQIPLKVNLRGFSIGPSVCLNRYLVNFGGIYVGNKGKRYVELYNHSLAAARFQFQVDNTRSTFKICPATGVIQPYSTTKLEVSFHPFAARSFYKRTYCLIHHHDPLVLDFVGICVPRPRFLPAPISFGVKVEQAVSLPFPTDTFQDFVAGDHRWGVKFETEQLEFGFRDPEMMYPDHTSGLGLTAISCLPYDTVLEWSPDPSKVFTVSPMLATLPAKSNVSFSVNFKPNFPGAFYDAQLECYIYPTTDGYDEDGPPWKYSFSSTGGSPSFNTTAIKSTLSSSPESSAVPPKSGASPILSRKSMNVAAASTVNPEVTTKNGNPPIKEAANSIQKNKGPTSAAPPQTKLPESKSKPEEDFSEELHSEHGYYMKVNMSRLNEGQDINFMVAPISNKLNLYELPETLLTDEEIHRYLNNSNGTSLSFENGKECGSHGIQSLHKRDIDSSGKKSSTPPSESGSIKNPGSREHLHVTISTNIPSIHPSKLILPGNDEASTTLTLDGVKRMALPLCITLKVTGHTFTPQRVPFIPNVKLPLKAVMYASTPNSPTGRTFLIKNLSDLPCFYRLDQVEGIDAFQVRPLVGLIHGNQHEILVARMVPKLEHSAIYKADIGITFNIQDNCLVGLFGYCEIPSLGIRVLYESSARGSEVVCPITIAGCVTYTYVELQNPTGFYYRFWIEPADVEEDDWMIISPKPSSGYIAPNETIPISWKFAPKLDGMYYLFWRFCFEVDRTCVPTKDGSLGYYEFILPFTGIAKTSYLKAEPSTLDFDMIQIFDTKSKLVMVTNDGECPVNAHFILHHEQWLTNFPPELVSVNPSRLSLKPQESAPIVITVRPAKTTIQNFYVIYNLEFKDDDEFVEGATMDVFEKHLIDISFMGDHTVFKVTDIIMDSTRGIWDAEQCWSMFSISLLNQLLTPHHYAVPEGTVPQVSSVPFRFPPAPIHSEPYVIKIHLHNVSELKGYWAVFTKPPNGWRRHLQQKICGACGTSEFKDGRFMDSPDLASQIWAKKFNYNASPGSINKVPPTCNTIKDLSYFEITPTNGSLKSKESQVITIKYFFTSLGVHDVSILLRIFPAIFIWLDLRGRTLDVNQPFIQLMNKTQMNLHPVCLSDIDPPVQIFWLYNGGNVVASYSVDLEPFEKLKDDNFGHPVIECLTPKGDVPPRSWGPVKIRFSPLEYSNYTAPLMIYPHYEKTPYHVMLIGNAAMNPSVSLRPAANTDAARKFVLFSHGVPVTISPSHMSIGHLIPTGHSVTRLVFLTNLHSRNTMKYYWENIPIEGGGMISFHPNCGRLAPKEEASCKIIIKAGDTATVLSVMINCTIEDETAHVLYEFVLNQWRDYMKNTQLRDSEQSSNEVSHKPEKPETYSRLLAVSLYIGSAFGQFDNISAKEKSRMGSIAPVQFNSRGTSQENPMASYPFTATGSQLCQSIMSDMIWDMIQSPSFASFCRLATKRKAPLFEEYADAEGYKNDNNNSHVSSSSIADTPEGGTLCLYSTCSILEKSIFNLLHEMAERYAHSTTRTKWSDVPPVQPKAFIDVEKHKKLFQ